MNRTNTLVESTSILRSNEFYWYSDIYIYISNIPYYSSGVRMPPCNNPQKTDEKLFCKKQLFCKLCEFISVKQSPSPVKISTKNHRSIFPPIMVRWQIRLRFVPSKMRFRFLKEPFLGKDLLDEGH